MTNCVFTTKIMNDSVSLRNWLSETFCELSNKLVSCMFSEYSKVITRHKKRYLHFPVLVSKQRPLQFHTYTPHSTQEKTERRKHASIRDPAAQKRPRYKMQKTSKIFIRPKTMLNFTLFALLMISCKCGTFAHF